MARLVAILPPYRPVDINVRFPAVEEAVLDRWRERDIFRESVRRRAGAEPWVFYEGPPTANGRPGSHHVLARVFKDLFPRFHTMRGRYVARKGGWDCHGLPVEIAVERKLGFKSKEDIERYGIAEFNAQCRDSVFEFVDDWNRLTERIGFWVDLDDAYQTMAPSYVESVWWALSQMWKNDLLFEGHKVVPYCARCGTALSSHEVAEGYKDVTDRAAFVRFPVTADHGALRAGDSLIAWTTTPWTLVSNAALAVNPDLTYVRTSAGDVVLEDLIESVLGTDTHIVARFAGSEMAGAHYEPPFKFIPTDAYGDRGHTVLTADFVSSRDGTGVVHTAVAFGEDDYRLGQAVGLTVVNPVRLDGTFDERIGEHAGRWVKDADDDLIDDLDARGRLLRVETYTHSYPHCWRCGTPLLYYAKPSWYVRTSALRDRLLDANNGVDWRPPHIKEGRFGRWLENNVDWAISRERYWGTPLPIWRCGNGHAECLGSLAEVEAKSGGTLDDPHRPYVDEHLWQCDECGDVMRRVPEVIDVWFDSGCVPFAQYHAPFAVDASAEPAYVADYICEGLDQTRGWFYSLLAVSTLLFDRAPYKTVLCLGLLSDAEGRKMSKSLGNVVSPYTVLDEHGADAFRWYFLTNKQPWDGYLFSVATVGESVRQFLLQFWNTYAFHVLYANVNSVERTMSDTATTHDIDRWILSRLNSTVEAVTEHLEAFDATAAGRAISELVDDLSNWYVRRSRRRFWDGAPEAFSTLRTCLLTIAKLVAPFCPFVADEVYENLDGTEPSVHLCDWPEAGPVDHQLLVDMGVARETVRLGLSARARAKQRVRQPLREAVIVAEGAERTAIERMAALVREELNVKELRFVAEADELATYELKPNFRALGPRFGPSMPLAAAAIGALDPAATVEHLRAGDTIVISVDGHDHMLTGDDLIVAMQPLPGYELEREGSHAVALDTSLDSNLVREGLAREVVHAVQAARKNRGFEVADRIQLTLAGHEDLLDASRVFSTYIAGETLASTLNVVDGAPPESDDVTVDGKNLRIGVVAAG